MPSRRSTQEHGSRQPAEHPGAAQRRPHRCDTTGKKSSPSTSTWTGKPDVWKFYQPIDASGAKIDVLTCKEVDLNLDGKKDLVYYYDDKGKR